MQPSERGAPGPRPARRRAGADQLWSRQPPAARPAALAEAIRRSLSCSRMRKVFQCRRPVSSPTPLPSPPPRAGPCTPLLRCGENGSPRASAHRLSRPVCSFKTPEYFFGLRRRRCSKEHPRRRLASSRRTHECVRCLRGKASLRCGGLLGCPGAVHASRPHEKGDPSCAAENGARCPRRVRLISPSRCG